MGDTRKYREFGLAVQTALGTAASAPMWKIISNGKGVLETVGGSDRSRGSTSAFTVDSAKKVPHFRASLPVDIYTIAKNGFGAMCAGLGDDTVTTPTNATNTRLHTIPITDADYEKFWTIWGKDARMEQQIVDALMSKLSIQFPKGRATATAEWLGCSTAISATFSGGSAAYVGIADRDKKIRSSGFFLWFGTVGDKIRSNIVNASLDFDMGIDPESGKYHGSLFAHDMESGDIKVTGVLEAVMEDAVDIQRAWGNAVAPDGTDPILPLTMGEWGPSIEKAIGSAVEGTHTGTVHATAAGTYTGTESGHIEIEITTAGAQDKFKWRHVYDDGTAGSWHTDVSTVKAPTTPITLENGITVIFDDITGAAPADTWEIRFDNFRYGVKVVFDEVSMDEPVVEEQGTRAKVRVPFEAISTPGGTIGTIYIYSTDTDAYNEAPA